MSKWHGVIGYSITKQIDPGVWKDDITEVTYSGDIIRNSSRRQNSSDSTNDNITVNNLISIIADPYAYSNFHSMKYVQFMGSKWSITGIDASQYPRLILTIGEVVND